MPKGRSNNNDATKKMKKGKIKVDVDVDTPNKTNTRLFSYETEFAVSIVFAQKESKNEGDKNHDTCFTRSKSGAAASEHEKVM
jgi:hypothetical protein